MFRSKLKELKALEPLGLLPVLFTIGEPILFGIPIVFNPYLGIPYVLSSATAAFVNWGLTSLGLVKPWIVQMPWMTPAPFQAFLGTGGDVRGLILVVVDFLIGLAIYYPFWKMFEKSLIEKEESPSAS
jgi:PTS system cellobiose-specific IIC component